MTRETGYHWGRFSEEKLLQQSFSSLKLEMKRAPFWGWVEEFLLSLREEGFRFVPHLWIGEEWFSPDGVPGIAIPFYLCHPRLKRLHRRYLYHCEGGTREEFFSILRHEAGHAFETAYGWSRRKKWRTLFGNPNKPYPTTTYTPNPLSNRYVQNIKFWYAQSHPHEDFAETFAVCLRSETFWRRRYRHAPEALKKLEYVSELFDEARREKPKKNSRAQVDPIHRNTTTLGAFYEEQRAKYRMGEESSVDGTLLRLFVREGKRGVPKARTFLLRHRAEIRKRVGMWTNASPVLVEYLLEELAERAGEMNLVLGKSSQETLLDALCMLTHEVALLTAKNERIRVPF
ncbi:putative zinc-binding metallopeptidase [bacterium]|nr:putative zinc-binding metallopeptidase [bacterium]